MICEQEEEEEQQQQQQRQWPYNPARAQGKNYCQIQNKYSLKA